MADLPDDPTFLIARVRRGDEDAFRLLLERYRRTIETTLLANGIDSRDAAFDLAQEVALKVWQRLGDLREPRRFQVWLRSITANAARDFQRRRAARREQQLDSAEIPPAEGTPLDQVVRRSRSRAMADVLRGEGRETAALLAARAEGAAIEELAARAGVTPAALKMRLTRARQRLLRRLAVRENR